MPIVVGCRVFSPINISNDWLEMPPPGAIANGGHAMLIYGYKDEKLIPGGGYFLFKIVGVLIGQKTTVDF